MSRSEQKTLISPNPIIMGVVWGLVSMQTWTFHSIPNKNISMKIYPTPPHFMMGRVGWHAISMQIWTFHIILNKKLFFSTELQPTPWWVGVGECGFSIQSWSLIQFLEKQCWWAIDPHPTTTPMRVRVGKHYFSVLIWKFYSISNKIFLEGS